MLLSDITAGINVAEHGYEWQPLAGDPDFGPRRRKELTESVIRDGSMFLVGCKPLTVRTYDPFANEKTRTLFYQCAELQPTESAVLSFANAYGTLRTDAPTSLLFWRDEIAKLADAVALWEAIKSDDAAALRNHVPREGGKLFWAPVMFDGRRDRIPVDINYRRGDLLSPATDLLRFILSRQMQSSWRPVFTSSLRFKVTDLLPALWMQLAIPFYGNLQHRRCEHCGTRFEIDESRSDRKFCDNSCQMKAYRRRQKDARRYHAEGKTVGQIATLLDSDIQTVRGWLNPRE